MNRHIPSPFSHDFLKGGPGSGNFGHRGRAGIRGGSSKEGGAEESASKSRTPTEVKSLGKVSVGSVFKVKFDDGTEAAFKPDHGNSLIEFEKENGYKLRTSITEPPPQSAREVFAYELDKELGLDVVPKTEYIDMPPRPPSAALKERIDKSLDVAKKVMDEMPPKSKQAAEKYLESLQTGTDKDREIAHNELLNAVKEEVPTYEERAKIFDRFSDIAYIVRGNSEELKREAGGTGKGHVQTWVRGETAMKIGNWEMFSDEESFHRLAALDVLIGNTDRHEGNFMMDSNGKFYAIDNNLSMTTDDKEFRSIPFSKLNRRDAQIPEKVKTIIKNIDIKKVYSLMKKHGISEKSKEAFNWRLGLLRNATKWSDIPPRL